MYVHVVGKLGLPCPWGCSAERTEYKQLLLVRRQGDPWPFQIHQHSPDFHREEKLYDTGERAREWLKRAASLGIKWALEGATAYKLTVE